MKSVQRVARVLAAARACALAVPRHALTFDVLAGRSVTSSHHAATAAFLDAFGDGSAEGDFVISPMASLGWIHGRRCKPSLDHDVAVLALGVRAERAVFFGAFELGYADRTTDALSSHAQFASTLGWSHRRFVVLVRHISNGHLFGGKNLGETMLLLGWRLR